MITEMINPTKISLSSSMITPVLSSAVISIIIAMVFRGLRRRLLLPPGPWFFQVRMAYYMMTMAFPSRVEHIFEKLAMKYGKMFSFSFGSDVHVIISDPEIIREAFVRNRAVCSDRQIMAAYKMIYGGDYNHRILLANGPLWKTARRVVGPCLRNIGTWGQQMESIIIHEADSLLGKLGEQTSKSFDPRHHINRAVANVIQTMVHGYSLDLDDPKLQQMIDSFQVTTSHPVVNRNSLRYFPFFYYMPRLRPLRQAMQFLKTTLSTAVYSQAIEYDHNNINTIVQRIMQAAEQDESTGEDRLKTKEVWRLVFDLMLAGTDTTANTLQWAVLIMAHYPEIQKKVHEEIDRVLDERGPRLQDKKSMPYLQATIMEILRIRPVVPMAIPHVTTEEIVLRGYTIPKGAILTPNIWSCHHSAEFWDNPEVFKPDRFLTNDMKSLVDEPLAYMPFSCGSRKCLGDQLAKNELFLIFAKIMQKFNIDFALGDRPESLDEGFEKGVILRPNAMKIRLLPRAIYRHEE
ncbi:cytochrome P450 2U1-like [Lytechinus variegatus]|uniref:cytochrome P450 2U1-like n=1 Tax=Lytechinus variegatus TaxID=7654 RepID=UPI001BB20F38|nr:cytochrome P450 2U1-like [Lytechinus variegatus]